MRRPPVRCEAWAARDRRFADELGPDVHDHRDVVAAAEHVVPRDREARQHPGQRPGHPQGAHQPGAVHGRLEQHRPRGRERLRPTGHPVHLQVVGVAVAAVGVVPGEDGGALLVEDRGDLGGRLVHGYVGEAPGAGRRSARHAGVVVAQPHHAGGGQGRGGRLGLGAPYLGEGPGGEAPPGEPGAPVGGEHEHDAVPGRRALREPAAGQQ